MSSSMYGTVIAKTSQVFSERVENGRSETVWDVVSVKDTASLVSIENTINSEYFTIVLQNASNSNAENTTSLSRIV